MLVKGQETPILVRSDGSRFVLVEGLHRLEACKALGGYRFPPTWFKLASIDLRRGCCWSQIGTRSGRPWRTQSRGKREWHQKAFANRGPIELSLECLQRVSDDNHHVDPGASPLRRSCERGR